MKLFRFSKRKRTARRSCGSAFLSVIRRGIRALKALPGTLAGALRQPAIQYRLALLLAALLAILLGWTTVVSTLPHTPPVAFIGRL